MKKIFFLFMMLICAISLKAQNYENITQKIDTINGGALGSIYLLNSNAVPIASGSGSKSHLIYSAATTYGKGKVIAIGHDGVLVNNNNIKYDQLNFLINSIKWLNSTKKTILIKNGWANENNMSFLISELKKEGYTISSTNNKINNEDNLSDIGIIIFGNDWNNFQSYSELEINTIDNFTKKGGSILIAGLGWSYSSYSNKDMASYSMNNIANIFGLEFGKDVIDVPYIINFYPSIKNLTVGKSLNILWTIIDTTSNLVFTLQNNEIVKKEFSNANLFISNANLYLPEKCGLRDTIFETYSYLFNIYSNLFSKNIKYNKNTETSIIWNRERMYKNFIDSKELTNDIIAEIGKILKLENEYLDIWKEHQILLMDNFSLDTKQLEFTKKILDLIPSELHNLGLISFKDFLGQTNNMNINGKYGACNTFIFPIGQALENQFPYDVSPGTTSIFCSAMSHEINHIVNDYYIHHSNDKLKNRHEQLIKQAGSISQNYLRSSLPNNFFVNNPYEFFASISNEWFTNSKKVLELGLLRYNKNYYEPINQFLFYADVYSLDTDSTIFYLNDINGNISSKKIPIKRDSNNNINQIIVDNTIYNFILDMKGNVMEIDSTHIMTQTTTSVNEIKNQKLDFYPNPATTHINIDSNMKTVEIYSISGAKQFITNDNFGKIDVSNLQSGMYIIKAENYDGELFSNKFIKQ